MKTIAEQMGIKYKQVGDYLLPDLEAPELPRIGKYGRMRETYLSEHKTIQYMEMWLDQTLKEHLESVDKEATEMVERLVSQMAEKDGTDNDLKNGDPMKWVGLMNNYHNAAEEIVFRDLIYA